MSQVIRTRRRIEWIMVAALAIALCKVGTVCGQQPSKVSQATAIKVPANEAKRGKPVTHEGPLGTVSRELYIPYPRPGVSAVISCDYTGASGLRRFERLTCQILDDVYQDPEVRYSDDNGRTWTPWKADPATDIFRGTKMWWQFSANGFIGGRRDPESGKLVAISMLRCFTRGDPRRMGLGAIVDFAFYSVSSDDGKTWGPRKQLKYEPGPDYNPKTRETPEFLAKNHAVFYYNILVPKSGGVVAPLSSAQVAATDEHGKPRTLSGVRCFLGKWNPEKADYNWTTSAPITVSRKLSGYLEEPWLAELVDGRLLVDMRGTNQDITMPNAPGRHWFALSSDGGKTWTQPVDWRFDDGSQFFSPATMAKILRHSVSGKLYWFGNISRKPVSGNMPRYPLYIAEIDEAKPAIKRATLTVIDDYNPNRDADNVQFSNFYVFENRQTHQFELYLSPYGQYTKPGVPNAYRALAYQADVCKYVITLK